MISDMVMPEMSGLELRQHLSATRPSLPLLLMSGYSQEAITRLGNHGSPGPIIEKPFTVQGLLGKGQRGAGPGDRSAVAASRRIPILLQMRSD